MACPRCGGRMLSRSGASPGGLVCSDCGTPHADARHHGSPHPLITGLTLVTLAGFALLLFFLTNWRPLSAQQAARQRGLIRQVTTGEFVREPSLLEQTSQAD